jgi:hypothetical protein
MVAVGTDLDVLVIHRSLALSVAQSDRFGLVSMLRSVPAGKWICFTPPSRTAPGMLGREDMLEVVRQCGFGPLSGYDNAGAPLQGNPENAFYIVARRSAASAIGIADRAPKFWLAEAQEAIRKWDQRDGSDEQAEIRSATGPGAMLQSVLTSSASETALRPYDRFVKMLLQHAGWPSLRGKSGELSTFSSS